MVSIQNRSYSLIAQDEIQIDIKEGQNEAVQTNQEMGAKWTKFWLLMWKNWVLQKRKPVQTAVEIIAPVLFSILLVVIRSLVDPEHHDTKIYPPFCPLPIPNLCNDTGFQNTSSGIANGTDYLKQFSLVYSPSGNEAIDRTMEVLRMLKVFHNVTGYNNSEQMEAHFVTSEANKTFAAIQFDDGLGKQNGIPKDVEVNIRFPSELRNFHNVINLNHWRTNVLYPVYKTPGPRSPKDITGAPPGYYAEGFLAVQVVITYIIAIVGVKGKIPTSLTELFVELSQIPAVNMRRFPYAAWTEDPLLPALESFVGVIIMLSFVYTCINTVKVITTEKERQLKEAMKIMGLPNWLHWTAWFIKTFVFLFISVVLIVTLLKITWYPSTTFSVFTKADPSVMFLFLVLYMCATITFCFAISVFFSKANTAATVAGLLWFMSYAPYLFLQQQYDVLNLSTKLGASLGSNTAMAYGFQLMLMYEGTGEGIQWSNIFQPNTPDDSLTLGMIMVMLIIDALIYLLIAVYVEAILPGEYGIPLPWYFPFTYSFWCGRKKHMAVEDSSSFTAPNPQSEYFETEPDLKPGIRIQNLRKVFRKKAAVRNLTLNMYEDQITVLLGHNGAGKTTTMCMLTGMFPPTSGTALIDNKDIRTDMKGVRASLGLCPQHNILFDDLTVEEHLYFFGKLKGLRKKEIKEEVQRYVELLDLVPKAKAKSSTLSGGMKRKLCVGMALCGKSKFVMLDEPTAGMDPSARRSLWDLLQKQKDGRTILLTTHFMDEADLLGDRIAIMAGGELQCCGSSFFLKKQYGAGYHLIIEKAMDCDVDKVTEVLAKHIPTIQIHENVGTELTYLLAEEHAAKFEELLSDLESQGDRLGVKGYGISLTTLEEVFMQVGADHGQEENYNNEKVPEDADNGKTNGKRSNFFIEWLKTFVAVPQHTKFDSSSASPTPEAKIAIDLDHLLTGSKLVLNQFRAMFMKRGLSIWRTWILQFIQILLPVAFLIIAIVVNRNMNNTAKLPKLRITLRSYEKPVTLIEKGETDYANVSQLYKQVLGSGKVRVVDSITAEMLNLTDTIPSTVRLHYLIGASFNRGIMAITAWFNNDPYHTPPLALGVALNTAYKHYLGTDYNIRFSNHPLPFTANEQVKQLLRGNSMGFNLAFNLAFSMAFVSSFYVLFYVRERVCKSKHLQFVSGVKVYVYWFTNLACDLVTFIVTIVCIIVTLAAFQEDGFRSGADLARMFLLLFYFSIGVIPMMYVASYLFNVPSTGYTRMTLFSVFTGVAAFLVVQVLGSPGLDLEYVANGLHWFFLIIPHYSLATGIRDAYTTYATNKMCRYFVENCIVTFKNGTEDSCWHMACHNPNAGAMGEYCCERTPDYYKWAGPGIGRNLFYTLMFGLILFVILILVEYNLFTFLATCWKKARPQGPVENPNEDPDVHDERQTIYNTPLSQLQAENTLILKDVTKYYKKLRAVNGICLAVQKHECFGLLGINGAGKTSTFKMMTGDVSITYGDAWVEGYSIKTEMKDVQRLIGYCPQFDALLDDLTAKESLIMFALLRGVPLQDCKHIAKDLATEFDFQRHLRKKVKALSGGNKRKLSTAIALIGDPPVLYLDEPTTGMDPSTKRHLWNAICRVRDQGKCVILTSHSMEECEALCTRLAIMVNGEFKCLGSTQHLKNKFAEGYTLTIKVKKVEEGLDTHAIEEFIGDKFPKAVLRERHQELLTYYIMDKSIPCSRMFGILEQGKKELNIEDYSLGQSSLEQVFLTFTKYQV